MSKQVKVYDFDTKQVTEIPESELAPGMVIANVQGVGRVWINVNKVNRSTQPEHQVAPFNENVRAFLREIKSAVDEHYQRTIEEWEDGFRRDLDPEKEIAIWLHMARTYSKYVSTHAHGISS